MAVTPGNIAVELGRTVLPDSPEYAQWELWIADARMLISARLGDLSALDQERLDYVVRQAVTAHARRPDDATQVDISVDDARSSRTYRSSKGRVEIIDDWWALLAPPTTNGRAFSVSPTGSASGHLPWCALAFAATYCSCGAELTNGEYPLFEGGVLSGDDY